MERIPMDERISVTTAAIVIGQSDNWVRWALQDRRVPFGVSVRSRQSNGKLGHRFSYYINKYRLAEYACVPVEEIERINREVKAERRQKRKQADERKDA